MSYVPFGFVPGGGTVDEGGGGSAEWGLWKVIRMRLASYKRLQVAKQALLIIFLILCPFTMGG